VLFLFLGGGTSAIAQVDPRAAPIVRALEAHYRNIKTLQAVFLERYSDGQQAIQIESGMVYFSRPGRMRWEYESPEKKVFLVDGKLVWFYVPADRTVMRSPIKESTDWRTPLALLMGKAKLSELCDRINLAGTSPGTAGNVVLSCLPRGSRDAAAPGSRGGELDDDPAFSGQRLEQVFLEVNPGSGELADLRILEPGGVQLEYRFGNWKENLPLDNSLFRFQTPVGVAILGEPSTPNP